MTDDYSVYRALREGQMLTKTELARKAGVSVLTVDRIEKGMPCRLSTQRKILFALGLSLPDVRKILEEDRALRERPSRALRTLIPAVEGGEGKPGLFPGLLVLVVDDDESVRDLLRSRLEYWGCRVEAAADGEDAVAAYGSVGPDLVLMDLEMPRGNGYDVSRDIREQDPEAAIVLMTGASDTSLARRALEKGLVKLALTKPFHVAQLEMAIREATRKPRTQEAPPSKKGAVA